VSIFVGLTTVIARHSDKLSARAYRSKMPRLFIHSTRSKAIPPLPPPPPPRPRPLRHRKKVPAIFREIAIREKKICAWIKSFATESNEVLLLKYTKFYFWYLSLKWKHETPWKIRGNSPPLPHPRNAVDRRSLEILLKIVLHKFEVTTGSARNRLDFGSSSGNANSLGKMSNTDGNSLPRSQSHVSV